MFAHRRTGERAENAMTVDIRGGVEKCINVVKYNKKGEKGRESVAAAVRCVGESWERGESAGILSASISVAGESACSSSPPYLNTDCPQSAVGVAVSHGVHKKMLCKIKCKAQERN